VNGRSDRANRGGMADMAYRRQADFGVTDLLGRREPFREDKVQLLSAALRDPGVRCVLVTGPAGVGKTWLGHATLANLAERGWLVGRGRFVEGQGQASLAPIMAALSEIIDHALTRQYQSQTAIASIAEALGAELDVLIDAGLQVSGLMGSGVVRALDDRAHGMIRITAAARCAKLAGIGIWIRSG
jgi:hypothetical protein